MQIERARLEGLLKIEEKMRLLEAGGVDNWEWYGESLKEYDNLAAVDWSGVVGLIGWEFKYDVNQTLYYNDSPCRFVEYLSKDIAVIVVSISPKIDDLDGSGWCTPCNIGGKERHTCYEYNDVIDELANTVDPTVIPLIVNVNLLHEKPPIVCKHEKEIEKIKRVVEERKKDAARLAKISADLTAQIAGKKAEIKTLNDINSPTEEEG